MYIIIKLNREAYTAKHVLIKKANSYKRHARSSLLGN